MVPSNRRVSPTVRRKELLAQYPDYCTVTDVAQALGVTKRNVRHAVPHLKTMTVDGMLLFQRESVRRYAALYTRDFGRISRMGVIGPDVPRLQRICEVYYRTQYDVAPPDILKLAKRLAGL